MDKSGDSATGRRHPDGFADAVRRHFGFLETEFGFRCLEAGESGVRYESDRVFVRAFPERGKQLEVKFGLLPHAAEGLVSPTWGNFNSTVLLRSVGFRDEQLPNISGNTPEAMEVSLREHASLIRRYAEPLLAGDAEAHVRLAEDFQQRNRAINAAHEEKARRRREAAAEWAAHPERFRDLAEVRRAAAAAYERGDSVTALAEWDYVLETLGQPLGGLEGVRYSRLQDDLREQRRRELRNKHDQ